MAAQNETAVSLPALTNKVRFHAVPRRYEETKPVIVQDFTHSKIMNLGNEIHRRTLERCSYEKEMAIRQAEQAVWDQAEHLKREALEKALLKSKLEHEKAVKKLLKTHEKAIKEKALQVEGDMQKLMLERLEETREEGERMLQEAVRRTEERCHQELLQAVAAARRQEQEAAANKAAEVAKLEHDKFVNAMEKAVQEKSDALKALEQKKDEQREEAVAHAHREEQEIAKDKLSNMDTFYKKKIENLQREVSKRDQKISELHENIQERIKDRDQVRQELLELRSDFQHFIDHTPPFEREKAGYLVPPVKTIELP